MVFLRWIAVLPAAIGGALIGYVVSWTVYRGMGDALGWKIREACPFSFILDFVASGGSSLLALYFGCRTAPSHRGAVFSTLIVFLAVYNYPAVKSLVEQFRWSVLVGLLGSVVGIIGATPVLDEVSHE